VVQLKKISYKLSKQIGHIAKKQNFDRFELQKQMENCKKVAKMVQQIFIQTEPA
jgi:hypothetical protein